MVLLPPLNLNAFQTLEYSAEGGSNIIVLHLEGVQDEYGQDNRGIYHELI